jgi:hypothetical protein
MDGLYEKVKGCLILEFISCLNNCDACGVLFIFKKSLLFYIPLEQLSRDFLPISTSITCFVIPLPLQQLRATSPPGSFRPYGQFDSNASTKHGPSPLFRKSKPSHNIASIRYVNCQMCFRFQSFGGLRLGSHRVMHLRVWDLASTIFYRLSTSLRPAGAPRNSLRNSIYPVT